MIKYLIIDLIIYLNFFVNSNSNSMKYYKKANDTSILDSNGNIVTDENILNYIKKLVIPPNYDNVTIYYENGIFPKILFKGYDNKGRIQVIYSKEWRELADKNKFNKLIIFGKKYLKIISNINEYVSLKKNTRNKMISTILLVINICNFRIGNIKYYKLYDTIGITNLKKKHLNFNSNSLKIQFIGKKKVENLCEIYDNTVINVMKELSENKDDNEFIFCTNNKVITSTDVNNWLKSYHKSFTTKMFRTFNANLKLITYINNQVYLYQKENKYELIEIPYNKRKKIVIQALKQVACEINNSPAICKKSYILPEIINDFLNKPLKYNNKLYIKTNNKSLHKLVKKLTNYLK